MKTISPLRYPGGKSRAIKVIAPYIIPNIPKNKKVCSPFFGGGSIEIYLAKLGYRVYGYDAFPPLVIFWKVLLKDPNRLANAVKKRLGVNKDEFVSIQDGFRGRYEKFSKVRCASTFYLLNRTSYSGTTLSGGMAIDRYKTKRWERRNPRFNLASIERLRNFSVKNLTVGIHDFEESIRKHKDALVYADPPYYIGKKKLYGNQGDMHFTQDDHERLARILKKRKRWILSYNDVPEVGELYRGFTRRKIKLSWSYGMSGVKSRKKKHSNEILVCSKDIKIQRQTKLS